MGASVFPAPGSIKSIQSGIISISAGNATSNATVTAVNLNKALLTFLGTAGTTANATDCLGLLTMTNSTTVTASRVSTNGGCNVSWQLVEYY